MIRLLQLTNFTGYRSLQLELAPVTVLIGSNAYGKSSLLYAISLLTKGLDVAARLSPAETRGPLVVRDKQLGALAGTLGGWSSLFTRSAAGTADYLAIKGDFSGGGWISHAELSARLAPPTDPDVALDLEIVAAPPSQSGTLAGSSALIVHVNTLHPAEVLLSNDELASVSSRMKDGVIRNRLIRLNAAAIERLNRALRQNANAEIVSRTTMMDAEAGAPLEVYFRRDGAVFEIAAANHALVSALALLCEVEAQISMSTATGERLLLLDEPEVHLHPRAQAGIAEYLVEVSRAADVQVISVTHSDDIVRRLRSRADSAILSIERPFSHVRPLYTQKDLLKALERTHELSPYSAVNFLASRRVLLVEGETDETILMRCALAYLGGSPDRFSRFEAWTRVPLDGISNAPASGLIQRLLSSPLIPPLERGDKLVVVTVLDRDYDKEPVHRVTPGPQVEVVEHVWSRHSIESLFIEADVLESMLLAALGTSAPVDLNERVKTAIAVADADQGLHEGAEDELGEYFRRTRRYVGKDAQAKARAVVRSSPADWHRGKDRAEFVLRHIRTSLPIHSQNKVRSSIAKMIESIPPEKLLRVKIPTEVQAFLDELVTQAM